MAVSDSLASDPRGMDQPSIRMGSWFTIEKAAYAAIALLALVVRFAGLGQRPMGLEEAVQAAAALDLVQGSQLDPVTAISPLLLNLQYLGFGIMEASEGLARFWPALVGTLLVLLPYGLRRELGRTGALVSSLLLAFSSSLVFWSRSGTGVSVALFAAMALIVGLAGWRRDRARHWMVWNAAALALMLLSAPVGYAALFLILPYALLALGRSDGRKPGDSLFGPGLSTAVLVGVLILFLGATGLFFNPAGLGILADLPVGFLQGFVEPGGYHPLWLLVQWIKMEPLVVLLGLAGLVFGLRKRNWIAVGLGLWLALGLMLVLVRPGRGPADLALLSLVLALLGGPAVAAFFRSLNVEDLTVEAGVGLAAGIAILGSLAIWVAEFSSVGGPSLQANPYLLSAIAAVGMLAALLMAYLVLYGQEVAKKLGISLVLFALMLLSLRGTFEMNHSQPGARWGSYEHTVGTTDGRNLTEYLFRLASQRGGDLRDLPVGLVVMPGNEAPALLRWHVRTADVQETTGVTGRNGEVLVSLDDQAMMTGQSLAGRSYRVSQTWRLDGIDDQGFWKWLLFGQSGPIQDEQRGIVWIPGK
ncbi:MAG: glycosyltransferase family 39 protein [Chloroflexota bacterium]|nr:glycosyltransferase family 39 protein [Chloroflexota bacterium]